jgi:hypothetical protein
VLLKRRLQRVEYAIEPLVKGVTSSVPALVDDVNNSTGCGVSPFAKVRRQRFAALIGIVTAAYYVLKAVLGAEHRRLPSNVVLAFWIAYISVISVPTTLINTTASQ